MCLENTFQVIKSDCDLNGITKKKSIREKHHFRLKKSTCYESMN